MDTGFTRPIAHGISPSTNATDEKPKVVVPGPQATHAERQKFVNHMLKPGRQRFELSQLNEQQLARFIAYFRIKSVDANDANEVARFINGYEQYCGNEKQPDRDNAVASLREHIAKESNAAEFEAILSENTELLGDLLTGRAAWEFFNLPDRDGRTPLMRAVRENDEALVRDLLSYGAEANVDAVVVAVHHNMPFSLKKCLILASEVERLLLPVKGWNLLAQADRGKRRLSVSRHFLESLPWAGKTRRFDGSIGECSGPGRLAHAGAHAALSEAGAQRCTDPDPHSCSGGCRRTFPTRRGARARDHSPEHVLRSTAGQRRGV
jgi:hypothetical protein